MISGDFPPRYPLPLYKMGAQWWAVRWPLSRHLSLSYISQHLLSEAMSV
jgi:hypothetical protein